MATGLLRYLMNVLRERGGALLGLARKGLEAIRSLLGRARGLVGPLLKRALTFVLSKGSDVVTSAGNKLRDSLESLKRKAQAFLEGQPAKPDPEAEETEISPEQNTIAAIREAAKGKPGKSSSEQSSRTVPTGGTEKPGSLRRPHFAASGGVRMARSSASPGAELTDIAPAIGRALVRALSRRNVRRPERPEHLHPVS